MAQNQAQGLIYSLDNYAKNNPVEKIYLHLDKPYYSAGEHMYIRAYLTDLHLVSENVVSHIIYVELSNNKKELIKRILLYSEEKEYAGQIEIPDTLPSDNYHIRAYTNWMRNTGEDYFLHRDIFIGNGNEKEVISTKDFDYQVNFFPEGGNLLEGFVNKVVFKALGNDGYGVDIAGRLIDSSGQELLRFSSSHLGMGSFDFTPTKNNRYTAIIESQGKSKEFCLSPPMEGIGLSLYQSTDSIYINIRSTSPLPEDVRLIAQSRHTVCYALQGLHREKERSIAISNKKFPTGIAQFILFKDDLPVSERLIYIDKQDYLRLEIHPDKEKYSDREKSKIEIKVTDQEGNPIKGSFSLSVTDNKVVIPSIESHNIEGTLLLDSDLRGYIENPGWYFMKEDSEKRKKALDILLCSQGWSRFVWTNQGPTEQEKYYPVESEFMITGRLTNILGKPIKDGTVVLLSNNTTLIPDAAQTNKKGQFGFIGFDCPDTTELILQGRTKRNHRTFLTISLDSIDNYHSLTYMPLQKQRIKQAYTTNYIEQASQQRRYEKSIWTIDLENVEVIAKIQHTDKTWDGMGRNIIGREDILDYRDIAATFRKKGVQNLGVYPTFPPNARERDNKNILIVDGVEDDFNMYWSYYQRLPGYMFESIEIVTGTGLSLFGARGGGLSSPTVLIIKMRKPQDIAEMYDVPTPGLHSYKPEGYCVRKEFFMPAYDKPDIKQSPTPDLRTTIYWNPLIKTNEEGYAEIEFFTADNVHTYSYVLEGYGNNQIGF